MDARNFLRRVTLRSPENLETLEPLEQCDDVEEYIKIKPRICRDSHGSFLHGQ